MENKFARSKSQSRNKYAPANNETNPDEQLTRLEDDIRRLKVEFDIYFNGAAKRPPYDTKSRVETLLKRLGDDRTLNFTQRYRYNSFAARYNAFRDLWRRTMQGREEGRDPISAARATIKDNVTTEASAQSFVCNDATRDVETVKNLYDALVEAKRRCGESTDLSFPRFHRLVAEKAEGLKDRTGCEKIKFSIGVEGGHVSFKAGADK
ncbi:MAG: MXAN_5187 C-terminal domain-containing protein [Pyrinomonadaceae bacterium]